MTDLTRLLASLKRRSAHVKEFSDDITFIKLEDLDALVEALEKAQQRNAELENYAEAEARGLEKGIAHLENKFSNIGVQIMNLQWLADSLREGVDK